LPILAGQDLDRIAVTRQTRRFRNASNLFLRTDDEGPAARRSVRPFLLRVLARAGNLVGNNAVSSSLAGGRPPDHFQLSLLVAADGAQLGGNRRQRLSSTLAGEEFQRSAPQ
jgi:hypothetical protein